MITLKDHHGEGQPIAPNEALKSLYRRGRELRNPAPQSQVVADAIAALDRALTDAGHKPGTWALILGNGAVLINEPVVAKTARMIARRDAYEGLKQMLATGLAPVSQATAYIGDDEDDGA